MGAQAGGQPQTRSRRRLDPDGARPTLALTVDEAIKLALDRNLDIAVQRLNPQTFDFSLAGLRAIYRPTLTSTLAQQSATHPSTQTISGAAAGTGIDTTTTTWNGGVIAEHPVGRRRRWP